MKILYSLLLLNLCLLAPTPRAADAGAGLVLVAGGAILGENLLSTLAVKGGGELAGYSTEYAPMFGYGMIGILTALYLNSSSNYLIPLVAGSLIGNSYYLYKTHSNNRLTLFLASHSMGLGPEGTSFGVRIGIDRFLLGVYRGDLGDQSSPGLNHVGTGMDYAEREPSSVRTMDLEFKIPIYKKLNFIGGIGSTWNKTAYSKNSDPPTNYFYERSFTNYFLESGTSYYFFNLIEVEAQIGWLLLRDQKRENFLRSIGSSYVRDNQLAANLKICLGI